MTIPDSEKNSTSTTDDMAGNMESLERRMLRLEELSNRQFQDIGLLTRQVTQLRTENDQLKRNGLITATTNSTTVAVVPEYTAPFHNSAEENATDNQDALTSDNTAISIIEEREEVWRRAKESEKDRIQVVYLSSAMQRANYQYPGTFEEQLQRPLCRRSDRPVPIPLLYLAPTDSASRLLSLPKELRMQIWVRAIGADATLRFNWYTRCAFSRAQEELTQTPGAELPRLRLTNSIINEDLRGYAKPVITVAFMESYNMCMHLMSMEKHLRSRITIIKVHTYESELAEDIARTIIQDRGLESNATSIYIVQEYFARQKVRINRMLSWCFKRFSVMSINIHRVVVDLHKEGFDESAYFPKERWVVHSTFRVRRAYANSESPYW